MQISLQNISKRYTDRWIIKNLTAELEVDHVYGVKGRNGSGKSTLLKMISGYLTPSKGTIIYKQNDKLIHRDNINKLVSFAAPYVGVLRDLTVGESIKFVNQFSNMRVDASNHFLNDVAQLDVKLTSKVSELSSGQTQKLSLALAICRDTPILLLDEPTTYLDQHAINWFHDLLTHYKSGRLLVIASNDANDFKSVTDSIGIQAL